MHYILSVFFMLIALAASGQNRSLPDYSRDWKRADSLAAKGLPKSALDIANRIYKQARAQKNYPQIAKAAIARMTFRSASDEDTYKELVNSLRADMMEVPEPTKSILQSVLGDVYWQYFQQNRYKFYDRATVNASSDKSGKSTNTNSDFTTWDAHQLVEAVTAAYLASVQAKALLQQTPIAAYEVLLKKVDPDARSLRPTLYDLLAHRAIVFFQNTEPDLLKPVFRFELNQPAYFAQPEVFARLSIQSQDSLSGRYQALRLYQQLLAFHLTDTNPDALADADVLRLAFVHQHNVVPDRDSLYRQALEKQITRFKNQSIEAVYAYQLAEFLANYGPPVRPLDDGDDAAEAGKPNPARWYAKQAADICRDMANRFPKTLAGKQAAQLLNRLLLPSYSIQIEQVNAPQLPFRALVSYQNVDKVLYRLIRSSVSETQLYGDGRINDEQKKKILSSWLKRPIVAEKSVALPDDGDLHRHSVEVPLMGLPIGQYFLLVTTENKFRENSEAVQYATFTVSALGCITRAVVNDEATQTVIVTNRMTGEPVRNAMVSLVSQTSLSWLKAYKPLKTDAQGWVRIPTDDLPKQSGFRFKIAVGSDTLLSNPQYFYNTERPEDQPQTYAKLFTDRAIYRPGQLIYVKGLLYAGKANQFTVRSNQDVTLEFIDQNGERIASQTLKTNDFGTVNTSFTAPTGRLTGLMSIQTPYGSASVRVEEYKRPTFEVKSKPLKESFKLGQTVTLVAEAKTFSGAVVDGAEVRYRVVRRLRPRWDWRYTSRYGGPRITNQTEITSGTALTDRQGKISVTFTATPDTDQPRENNPIFDFDVTIDVTDRAGETRSITQILSIGYSALRLALVIPEQVETDKPSSFPVRITNQAGEKVAAKAQVSIYRLQSPAHPIRIRLWPRPDRQLLSQAEFKKLFPNDVFANEDNPRSWPKETLVEQQTLTAPTDSLIKPDLSRYTSGEYVAELTATDSTGNTSKEQAFFTVLINQHPVASARPDEWMQVRQSVVKPGEEAIVWLGNSQPGWVLMLVEENQKIVRQEWLKTDGKPRRVVLPVTEKQRGGFAVHVAMIQNGRLYQKAQIFSVPFTDKQLSIQTQTFRNKLKPGEREEWILTVSGLDKKPAEMVATLYDASLDAFDVLDWQAPIYQLYSPIFYDWQAGGFGLESSNALRNQYHAEPPVPMRRYDQLIDEINSGQIIRLRGYNTPRSVSGAVAKMAAGRQASMSMQDGSELKEAVAAEPDKKAESSSTLPSVFNPRRNFNETAFFLPQLKTDEKGQVVLKFIMPEALTRWRLLAFAHTQDLKTGTLEREIITQKELMITANAPRFFREGDTIRLTARVNNLSEKALSATANLALFNAFTGEPIHQKFKLSNVPITVTVAAGQSQAVGWTLVVPSGLETVTCRLTAQAGTFTDGEEFTLPILSNRMLVTDTQPFWVNGRESKTFTLKPLANLNPELPVQHERLTVEVTSNPTWYALQALPYLMEYRYECAEQLFSRLYANSLAAHIIASKPAFKQVITDWQKNPPRSPLQSNEELKAIALENSPWLADARSQAERQAKLGQLLDANRMADEQQQAFEKLRQLQTDQGGFQWFGGMGPNLSVTLHILSGFGHLQKLGRSTDAVHFPDDMQAKLSEMQAHAIQYADAEMKRWLDEQKKIEQRKGKIAVHAGYFSVTQYLYARSFYVDQPIEKTLLTDLKQRAAAEWTNQSLQGQAFSALALYRFGDTKTANGILRSLHERARESDELGMYWPDNQSGLFWYEAPIETQAYLIEAFDEISGDKAVIDRMKHWLLRQKQTQAWSSTKATTEAVYALLLRGSDWLGTTPNTQVSLGRQSIEDRVTQTETITGYQKVTYAAAEIKPDMGVVQITKNAEGPAWGALYWQHFEPLDRVMLGSAGLSVQKNLYVQHDSPNGPTIAPITDKTALKPGDLIEVHLVLKTDRAMEFVHLKDSRASGFEPVATLSGYTYQNGLGYYQSPRDASTDFFISYLPVGTHVFEYDLRVAQTGDFSAGVATVQCFYAPEFSAHSTGERVKIR